MFPLRFPITTARNMPPAKIPALPVTNPPVPGITPCPVGKLLRMATIMSKRWTLLVLKSLCDGFATFTSIRRQYPSLSARVLAERLRELVVAGYVIRAEGRTHLDVRYSLSPKGKAFGQWIRGLERWLNEWEK